MIVETCEKRSTARGPARGLRGLAAALGVAALAISGPAFAQDSPQVVAGLQAFKDAGCSQCHGAFADGHREVDEMPAGANLRRTKLTADQLAETIRCGRARTGMPFFDEDAYTKDACYGMPLGQVPAGMGTGPGTLNPTEIADLVAYLEARVVGHPTISKDDCIFYYGQAQADARCGDYK